MVGKNWARDINPVNKLSCRQAYTDHCIVRNASLARYPKFSVVPNTEQAASVAHVLEQFANFQVRSLKMRQTMARMLQDNWTAGMGLARVGYNATTGTVEQEAQGNQELQMALQAGVLYRCEECKEFFPDMSMLGGMPGEPQGDEQGMPNCPKCGQPMRQADQSDFKVLVEPYSIIRRASPFLKYLSPFDFRWDVTAQWPWEDPQWVCFDYILPLDFVRNNRAYQNVSELEGSVALIRDDERTQMSGDDSRIRQQAEAISGRGVQIRELWARKTVKDYDWESDYEQIVMADELPDKALAHEINPWSITDPMTGEQKCYPFKRPPLVLMHIHEVNDHHMPISVMELYREAYMEYDDMRTLLRNHVRANIPQWLYDSSLITEKEADSLQSAIPHIMVGIENFSNKQNAIKVREQINLNMDYYRHVDESRRNQRENMGVTEMMKGGNIPGATATEINEISSANLNLESTSRAVEDSYQDAIGFMIGTARHFWTDDQWVPITGQPPMRVARDVIQADASIVVEVGSTTVEDDNVVRAQLRDIRAVWATAPWVNLKEVDRIIASRFPKAFPSPEKIIAPDVEAAGPEAEQLMMGAGIPVAGAKDGNLARHLEVHQAAMEMLAALPPEIQARVGPILQQHMMEEQANMQGGTPMQGGQSQGGPPMGPEGGGQGAGMPPSAPTEGGPPNSSQIIGNAQLESGQTGRPG